MAPAASSKPAWPPILLIICPLNWVRISSVISLYPNSRAFFSTSRLTMPRRKTGARSMRFSASAVHTISGSLICCSMSGTVASPVAVGTLLVDDLPEFFSRFKERHPFRRDRHGRARLRIATFLHPAVAQPKASKSPDLNFVASRQGRADAVEDRIDHHFSLAFREGGDLFRQLLNKLCF